MKPLALGVDLGGTNARAAVVDASSGEIVAAHKEPLRDRSPAKVVEVVRRAQEWFRTRYDAVTVDGVRVVFPDGWGLVRASNTQPLLVLRFEARTPDRLREIERLVRGKVEEIMKDVGA